MAITKLEDLDVFRVSKQLIIEVYPTLPEVRTNFTSNSR
jgi:hypothetical protein